MNLVALVPGDVVGIPLLRGVSLSRGVVLPRPAGEARRTPVLGVVVRLGVVVDVFLIGEEVFLVCKKVHLMSPNAYNAPAPQDTLPQP